MLTAADRDSFENRDVVKAIRVLQSIGEDGLFKTFVMAYDDNLSTPQDFAQLIDLTRNAGQTFTAMMIGRTAAGKGVILPERMYPMRWPRPRSPARLIQPSSWPSPVRRAASIPEPAHRPTRAA